MSWRMISEWKIGKYEVFERECLEYDGKMWNYVIYRKGFKNKIRRALSIFLYWFLICVLIYSGYLPIRKIGFITVLNIPCIIWFLYAGGISFKRINFLGFLLWLLSPSAAMYKIINKVLRNNVNPFIDLLYPEFKEMNFSINKLFKYLKKVFILYIFVLENLRSKCDRVDEFNKMRKLYKIRKPICKETLYIWLYAVIN